MNSGISDGKGGAALFAVGGILLYWAYFYGVNYAFTGDWLDWIAPSVLAFVALYLLGYGLWTVLRSATTRVSR